MYSSTISGHKSKRETRKSRFYAILSYHLQQIKPPGAPRQPLGEVSPNQRSRVVGAREHGVKFLTIARIEGLLDSTV
jgi:hypothetical protein